MRRAHLKDNMNQAAFLSLMPTGARWKNGKIFSVCAPGMDFRVPMTGFMRKTGDEPMCGTGDA